METAKPKVSPVLEIRFSPVYAWLLMGAGAVFFLLSLLFASPFGARRMNTAFDLFLAVLSLAAIVGGNYWRHHRHVVARLTPRQLILRRGGAVNWTDIAQIDKKEIHVRYRASMGDSEYVCIKLKSKRPVEPGLAGLLLTLKSRLTGYDIIVPATELSCSAEFFIAECRKRMAAATG